MNWRSGIFRIWVVLSACWLGYVIWDFSHGCTLSWPGSLNHPVCLTGEASEHYSVVSTLGGFSVQDWLPWLAFTFLPPLLILALGIGIRWSMRGFWTDTNSN